LLGADQVVDDLVGPGGTLAAEVKVNGAGQCIGDVNVKLEVLALAGQRPGGGRDSSSGSVVNVTLGRVEEPRVGAT